MRKRVKVDTKELKVAFEAVAGRQGGGGIFAIEDAAEEIARRTKLTHIAEQIASYDRGYAGNRRRCPQCGRWQQCEEPRPDGRGITTIQAALVPNPPGLDVRCTAVSLPPSHPPSTQSNRPTKCHPFPNTPSAETDTSPSTACACSLY
jgi:hypothetical protein